METLFKGEYLEAAPRWISPDAESEPEMYYPYLFASEADNSPWTSMYLVVRANRDDSTGIAAALRREVQAVDKDQPVYNVASMTQLMSASVSQRRFNMQLVGFFAALAVALAAVGLYLLLATSRRGEQRRSIH